MGIANLLYRWGSILPEGHTLRSGWKPTSDSEPVLRTGPDQGDAGEASGPTLRVGTPWPCTPWHCPAHSGPALFPNAAKGRACQGRPPAVGQWSLSPPLLSVSCPLHPCLHLLWPWKHPYNCPSRLIPTLPCWACKAQPSELPKPVAPVSCRASQGTVQLSWLLPSPLCLRCQDCELPEGSEV